MGDNLPEWITLLKKLTEKKIQKRETLPEKKILS
jgi:hypothetical protein